LLDAPAFCFGLDDGETRPLLGNLDLQEFDFPLFPGTVHALELVQHFTRRREIHFHELELQPGFLA